MVTEEKLVKIVDKDIHTRGVSVEQIDSQGALIVKNIGVSVPSGYDYIEAAYDTTTDTYTYKVGGSGGTTLKVVTVTYTDSTKSNISSVSYSDV